MGLDTKTYWLTDRQSQCDLDFDCDLELTGLEFRSSKGTAVWPEEELEDLVCDVTCAIAYWYLECVI
jgi:hypothetical protein